MLDKKAIEEKKQYFISLLKSLNREGIDSVLDFLEKSDFYYAPSSSLYHGNYEGGLLEHSLNVMEIAVKLYDDFKELAPIETKDVTRESVILCSLLHDICKTYFYVPKIKSRKNDMDEWEQYIGYEIKDQLPLWHGAKSVIMLQMMGLKLNVQEMLAIQWHMGAWNNGYTEASTKKSMGDAYSNYPLCLMIHCADSMATFILESNKIQKV